MVENCGQWWYRTMVVGDGLERRWSTTVQNGGSFHGGQRWFRKAVVGGGSYRWSQMILHIIGGQ